MIFNCFKSGILLKFYRHCNAQTYVASRAASVGTHHSFKYEDMTIKLAANHEKVQMPNASDLDFGTNFSDHMFEVEWTKSHGWGIPRIVPLHFLQMHPGTKVLHYAQTVFEGMKAFRGSKGNVLLFRPDRNMHRLSASARRACLPAFDGNELLKCIKKLISVDYQWVPEDQTCSLYIRPTFMGTENTLGVQSSNKAHLYVITSPVGPYFKQSWTEPVSLLANPQYVRASLGGVGEYKMACNYAPTLFVQDLAKKQGLHQVLWLYGDDHQITEVGAMNVFFLLRKHDGTLELVTPPLNGLILPGVVRESILELAREWNEFEVSERIITMDELRKASKNNELLEMFGSGTACVVCPVKTVKFLDEVIDIPTVENPDAVYLRFFKALTDIQYGKVDHRWSVPIDCIHDMEHTLKV